MNTEDPPICDYEGSDYQVSFWEQGGRLYEDRVEAIALNRLLPPGGELLLEVGAGAGRNTPRYRGFERVILLDYSRTQLQQAQARLGRGDRYLFVVADAYRLPFIPSLFDAATMIRTLHHMIDPPRALLQVRKVLRPGAAFILEYANKQNLKAILRYLLRRQEWSPFTTDPVEFADLNFDFHPRAVDAWLRESGFAVERQLTVSHFRIGLFKRLLPTGLLVGMDSLAQLTGDWWQLSPSVFVRSRAADREPLAVRGPGETADEPRRLPGFMPFESGSFFRCPECGHFPLEKAPEAFVCNSCSRVWAFRDGIYDFRKPLN